MAECWFVSQQHFYPTLRCTAESIIPHPSSGHRGACFWYSQRLTEPNGLTSEYNNWRHFETPLIGSPFALPKNPFNCSKQITAFRGCSSATWDIMQQLQKKLQRPIGKRYHQNYRNGLRILKLLFSMEKRISKGQTTAQCLEFAVPLSLIFSLCLSQFPVSSSPLSIVQVALQETDSSLDPTCPLLYK